MDLAGTLFRRVPRAAIPWTFSLVALMAGSCAKSPTPPSAPDDERRETPTVLIRPAEPLKMPGRVDCNSPAHWDGNTLYLFNSAPDPKRSSGTDIAHLPFYEDTAYSNPDSAVQGSRWIEATWKDPSDGTLYGWYHNEPHPVCPPKPNLTAPRIGAVRSSNNGLLWEDLGFVLTAPEDSTNCATENFYFAGGNGDFSVLLDEKNEHFYFFLSTYNRDTAEQGVAVARIRFEDRRNPAGKAWKWYRGAWSEPGLGGHLTPILPVRRDWHSRDADAFWGPSIHWNTHLNQYVILLNRAIDGNWAQEGVYVMFSRDLSDPTAWTAPRKLIDKKDLVQDPAKESGWYPQIIGTNATERETDKRAGRVARLFQQGTSRWELVFLRPGEQAP